MGRDARLSFSLGPQACALYHIIPAVGPVVPLGLVDRYLSVAAIADWQQTPERTTAVLLDGGTFGWFASAAPIRVKVNGVEVAYDADDGVFTVDCAFTGSANWVEIEHLAGKE